MLDVGCGIGNLALGLVGYLRSRYDGVDVNREAIAWCDSAITRGYPSFRFHHLDVLNRAYNPRGRTSPIDVRFPFDDRSFDFVFLGSVFTHMLPEEVGHDLREIARLLKPSGRCVASYFLLDEARLAAVDSGRAFMSFQVGHPSGACRLHSARVPEAAVAIWHQFIEDAHLRAGLQIIEQRRGRWADGAADDQDVLTAALRAR